MKKFFEWTWFIVRGGLLLFWPLILMDVMMPTIFNLMPEKASGVVAVWCLWSTAVYPQLIGRWLYRWADRNWPCEENQEVEDD